MESKKLVYVGKRSKLLKTIFSSLPKGKIISLKDAYKLHNKEGFKENKLVLFSLPEGNDIDSYFEFIKNVNCQFLINISSTCIYSRPYYENTFFKKVPKYVYIKSKAHKLVNERKDSKNLIVGVTDYKAPFPIYPFSKSNTIANDLKNIIDNFKEIKKTEIYSFEIIKPLINKYRFIPYHLRIFFKNYPYGIPLFIDFLYKVLNIKARYYSCISCFHFIENLRIGDGAFGTAASSKNELVFFSGRNNEISSNETLNTLTGFEQLGLDKYRHGNSTFINNGKIFKQWIFAPRIRSIFRKAYKYHVEEIKWHEEKKFFEVKCKKLDEEIIFFSKTIKLAAGTLENTRLSLGISENIPYQEVRFSDHFNTCIGKVNFEEILQKKHVLNTSLPFIFIRNNLIPINYQNKLNGFAEFRINSNSKNKLVSSFYKLLSYIFNRTGIIILKPSSLNVWVQLTSENMISIELKDDLKKTLKLIPSKNLIEYREKLIKLSKDHLKNRFESFENSNYPYFPNNHLWGGGIVLDNALIKSLLKKDKLKICGSPSKTELGPFHHTLRVAKFLKSGFFK